MIPNGKINEMNESKNILWWKYNVFMTCHMINMLWDMGPVARDDRFG